MKNKLIIISSPSGAGKTTLCKLLIKKMKNINLSISYTSRSKRLNEINGKDYYFVSKKKFDALKENNFFIETAKNFNNLYGSPYKNINRSLKYFIQVNIGNEMQKSGIPASDLDAFYNYCSKELDLNVIGLMVIPPNDKNTKKYFEAVCNLNNSLALKELSMGMSADYEEAVNYQSTYVRIGSLIFGSRS